jgi:hypothetical protein
VFHVEHQHPCRCHAHATNGLSPLCPADNHIDTPAAASAAHKPGAPIKHRQGGTVALGQLGGVGLDLMAGQSRHQTMSRTWAAAALPRVIGGPV